jgi:hypothetical protein
LAKYGSSVVTVTIDDAPGGTARIITPYVNTIGGIKVESITQQTNPFGTSSEAHTPVGVTKTPDIAISGFFDDTADVGPHVVFGDATSWALDIAPASVGRELVILAATGATFTITVHLVSYEVLPKNGALTEYVALVRQAAAGVWS